MAEVIATGDDAGRWLRHAVEIAAVPTHALTFRQPVAMEGNARCHRCGREITLRQFLARDRCAGREVAP